MSIRPIASIAGGGPIPTRFRSIRGASGPGQDRNRCAILGIEAGERNRSRTRLNWSGGRS
jgi:hypothetical protein